MIKNYNPLDLAKYIHLDNCIDIPQVDIDNIEELEKRMKTYLYSCSYWGIIPTFTGLSRSVGVSRRTLYNWESGKRRYYDERYKKLVDNYKTILESVLTGLLLDNKVSAPVGIFLLKNNYGYMDKPPQVDNHKTRAELLKRGLD